jgi:hypothetical protein
MKKRNKILECVGTIKGRFPTARIFLTITVAKGNPLHLSWNWDLAKYRTALRADGAYLSSGRDRRRVLGDVHPVDLKRFNANGTKRG